MVTEPADRPRLMRRLTEVVGSHLQSELDRRSLATMPNPGQSYRSDTNRDGETI
jgi:hypothetical protein